MSSNSYSIIHHTRRKNDLNEKNHLGSVCSRKSNRIILEVTKGTIFFVRVNEKREITSKKDEKSPPLILFLFFPGFCKVEKKKGIIIIKIIKMHHVETELFGI